MPDRPANEEPMNTQPEPEDSTGQEPTRIDFAEPESPPTSEPSGPVNLEPQTVEKALDPSDGDQGSQDREQDNK